MRRLSILLSPFALACVADADLQPGYAQLEGRVGFELAEDLNAYAGGVLGDWATDGVLPPGIALSADGWLEGVPEASGAYAFDVTVRDADGTTNAVAVDLEIPTLALMSGYEPFGGAETNPSIEALWPLQQALVADLDVRVVELPVVWDEAWELLFDEIELLNPDIIIATGQAGSDRMRFETRAVNEEQGTDNDGVARSGSEVVPGGPESLADRLPEDVMSAAMEAAGYATSISDDAGQYLCNQVFYDLMYHVEHEAERDDLVAGFIHVSPAGQYSSYAVEDITAAHMVGLEALSEWYAAGAVLRAAAGVNEHRAPVYVGLEGGL
jgi:pyroglutamyl-peptidase